MSLGGSIGFGRGVQVQNRRLGQGDRSLDIRERLANEQVRQGQYRRGQFQSAFDQLMAERDDAVSRGDTQRLKVLDDWIMRQTFTEHQRKSALYEQRAYREQQEEKKEQRRKAEKAIDYSRGIRGYRERLKINREFDDGRSSGRFDPLDPNVTKEQFQDYLNRVGQVEDTRYAARDKWYTKRQELRNESAENLAQMRYDMAVSRDKQKRKGQWTPDEKMRLRVIDQAFKSKLKTHQDSYGGAPGGIDPDEYQEMMLNQIEQIVKQRLQREQQEDAQDTSPFIVPGGEGGAAPSGAPTAPAAPAGSRTPVQGSRTPVQGAVSEVPISQPPSREITPETYTYQDINQILEAGTKDAEDPIAGAIGMIDGLRKGGPAMLVRMALQNRSEANVKILESMKAAEGMPGGPTTAEIKYLESVLPNAQEAAYREGIQMGKYVQQPDHYGHAFFDLGVAQDKVVGQVLPGGIFALNSYVKEMVDRGQIPEDQIMFGGTPIEYQTPLGYSLDGAPEGHTYLQPTNTYPLPAIHLNKELLSKFGQDGTPQNGQAMLSFLRTLHAIYSPRVKVQVPDFPGNPATARLETSAASTEMLSELLPSRLWDSSGLLGKILESVRAQDDRFARLVDAAQRHGVGQNMMNEVQLATVSRMNVGPAQEGPMMPPADLEEAFYQQGRDARIEETKRLLDESMMGAGR